MNNVNFSMSVLDIIVIAGYGLGMLFIGFYYSKKTRDAEGFLLGGEKMNPVSVRLSLSINYNSP